MNGLDFGVEELMMNTGLYILFKAEISLLHNADITINHRYPSFP